MTGKWVWRIGCGLGWFSGGLLLVSLMGMLPELKMFILFILAIAGFGWALIVSANEKGYWSSRHARSRLLLRLVVVAVAIACLMVGANWLGGDRNDGGVSDRGVDTIDVQY